MTERRKDLRVAIELNCKVHAEGETSYACIWDLSLGGARVAFDAQENPSGSYHWWVDRNRVYHCMGRDKGGFYCGSHGDVEGHEIGVSFDSMSEDSKAIFWQMVGNIRR